MLATVMERAQERHSMSQKEIGANFLDYAESSVYNMLNVGRTSVPVLKRLAAAARLTDEEEAILVISWLDYRSRTDKTAADGRAIVEKVVREVEAAIGVLRIEAPMPMTRAALSVFRITDS